MRMAITVDKSKNAVAVPRKEYEAFLVFRSFRKHTPTSAQKKALFRAEQNFVKGKTLSYNDLVKSLGFAG